MALEGFVRGAPCSAAPAHRNGSVLINHHRRTAGASIARPLERHARNSSSSSNSMNHVYRLKGTKVVTVTIYPVKGRPITVLISCEIT